MSSCLKSSIFWRLSYKLDKNPRLFSLFYVVVPINALRNVITIIWTYFNELKSYSVVQNWSFITSVNLKLIYRQIKLWAGLRSEWRRAKNLCWELVCTKLNAEPKKYKWQPKVEYLEIFCFDCTLSNDAA